MNKLFIIEGGILFNPTRGKHVLKCAESHLCEVNTLWKLACNFSTLFKVSRREFFLENRLQNWTRVTDFTNFTQEIPTIIEHNRNSIKYC